MMWRSGLFAAICVAPFIAAAQSGAAPLVAIVDLRGATPILETLGDAPPTEPSLATFVFPGAGGAETIMFGGVSVQPSLTPMMSDAQLKAASGRIGVALMHGPDAAPVLTLSNEGVVEVDLDGDGWPETIALCLSATQVHISAEGDEQDTPLWQRAFSLGYDVEPTCVD